MSDGPVAGWLVVEETAAAGGAERQCAVVGLENCSVVAAGLVSEVKLVGDAVPTADAMPAWAPALAGAFWAGSAGTRRSGGGALGADSPPGATGAHLSTRPISTPTTTNSARLSTFS